MNDFHSSKKTSWKKAEVSAKWRNLLGAFILVFLFFAIVSGVSKTLNVGKSLSAPRWDGVSPFSVVVNTKPVSVVVFNPSERRVTQLVLDDELYFETGDDQLPLVKLSSMTDASGDDLARFVSKTVKSPVGMYIKLEDREEASIENLQKNFKSFASFTMPIMVLSGQQDFDGTNVSSGDFLRLWWQAKSLSVNDLYIVDAAANSEEIIAGGGEKVLGIDEAFAHRLFSKYAQNGKLAEDGIEVEIINSSGDPTLGHLAADFASSVGASVVSVSEGSFILDKTNIALERESYTSSYLAKIFDCDIKPVPNIGEGKIQINLGADFSEKY